MNAFTQALSAALVQFLWQGAAVGAILWMVRLALRHRSANARYAVSCVALVVLVVLPVISAAAFYRDPQPVVTAAATVTRARAVAVPTERFLPIWIAADTPRLAWLAALETWALPVWSIGVLLFSLRLACGCAHLVIIRRCAEPADALVLEIVARLSIRMAVKRPVRLLMSMRVDGPAVVGWLRPMILLPPAALLGLTPQQLEAVLAHEIAHIRRHDYLVNLLQTLAETLLFYHPVVWWTSRQLRVERELCCDDLAVAASGDVATYARALTTLERLRVCTPTMAVGATSGSLIERIQRLLGTRTPEYGRSRWVGGVAVVVAIGCLALNASWWRVLAQSNDTPRFEVASIKPTKPGTRGFGTPGVPGRLTMTNATVNGLIRNAYRVQPAQVIGAPAWFDSDRFDVNAVAPEAVQVPPSESGPTPMQWMLRNLLADRFRLAVHTETRQLPLYSLVMARRDRRLGPELVSSSVDCAALRGRAAAPPPPPPPPPPPAPGQPISAELLRPYRPTCGFWQSSGVLSGSGITMAQLVNALVPWVERNVINETELTGSYDIFLQWTPTGPNTSLPPGVDGPPADPGGPSLFTALQEQLGLKLEPKRGPVDVLVIDHAEHPTED